MGGGRVGNTEEKKGRGGGILQRLKSSLRRRSAKSKEKEKAVAVAVVDGSDIRELVGNEELFASYIDQKFSELDRDRDGELSVVELQPAVADIGAALGLPPEGESPDSDRIYSEVLGEFTHGKETKVRKEEFKEVMSDILLGMAAGLNRDPVIILRLDGEGLKDFVQSAEFELDAIAIHLKLGPVSLQKSITLALEQVSVQNGMPPSSDPWVIENVIKPALLSVSSQEHQEHVPQELFLTELKKVLVIISQHLKEHPIIVAYSENTFDGSKIRSLLLNKFDFNKLLDKAWESLPKDHDQHVPKTYLGVVLDNVAPLVGLPPYGAIKQVDSIIDEALKLVDAFDGKAMCDEEFKKLFMEILGSIMLQLVGKPVHVSSSSVVHEPAASSSTLLTPPLTKSTSFKKQL